jgi:YHS domain-containing protein
MAVFVEDPERYLNELGVQVPDFFDTTKASVLDFPTRSRVNFETFFFAEQVEKARFDADPTRYVGLLVDPVNKMRFHPSTTSPRFDYNNRPFFFSSDSTRAMFAATPDSFAVARGRMMPKPTTK